MGPMDTGSDDEEFFRAVARVPSQPLEAPSLEGKTVGRYRIGARLGRGGGAGVYRAEDEKLRRVVAVKVLAADALGDAGRRRRFLREARLSAALTHANI